jgi:ferredoxin-thioredoxin reductase catalytic subunit
MIGKKVERVHCPVCLARFKYDPGWKEGDVVICPICGQKLKLERRPEGWMGNRVDRGLDSEIRDRANEFARIRGYVFNEMKEEVLEGLIGKNKRFKDFYCPCRMLHVPEYQCPCQPTRTGDVDVNGKCYCGFFWRRDAISNPVPPPPRAGT